MWCALRQARCAINLDRRGVSGLLKSITTSVPNVFYPALGLILLSIMVVKSCASMGVRDLEKNVVCDKDYKSADMAMVPAGNFYMGCNPGPGNACLSDEAPYREMVQAVFEIDYTEVTQNQYNKCVQAGICAAPEYPECRWDPLAYPEKPVVCLTWYQAKQFCEWDGKRLCSEAEWEKAARGVDGRIYPWGNEKPAAHLAHYNLDGEKLDIGYFDLDTMPVGSKKPYGDSPYGVSDLAGNVWEWTSDHYSTYERAKDGVSSTLKPTGSYMVLRSSAFFTSTENLRASIRYYDFPSYIGTYIGARCCRTPNWCDEP